MSYFWATDGKMFCRLLDEFFELRCLQNDYIDDYFSHILEDTLAKYETFIKAEKVRSIGASDFPFEMLATSIKRKMYHKLLLLWLSINYCTYCGRNEASLPESFLSNH